MAGAFIRSVCRGISGGRAMPRGRSPTRCRPSSETPTPRFMRARPSPVISRKDGVGVMSGEKEGRMTAEMGTRLHEYTESILPGMIPRESELTAGVTVEAGHSYGFFTDTTLCI